VIFINEGRVVFDGKPDQLSERDQDLGERFHQLSRLGS
jgi:hypothetical protein